MYNRDKRVRNRMSYKIKMWFYMLTFEDVIRGTKCVFRFIGDFLILLLGFIILFYFPAFFH